MFTCSLLAPRDGRFLRLVLLLLRHPVEPRRLAHRTHVADRDGRERQLVLVQNLDVDGNVVLEEGDRDRRDVVDEQAECGAGEKSPEHLLQGTWREAEQTGREHLTPC